MINYSDLGATSASSSNCFSVQGDLAVLGELVTNEVVRLHKENEMHKIDQTFVHILRGTLKVLTYREFDSFFGGYSHKLGHLYLKTNNH